MHQRLLRRRLKPLFQVAYYGHSSVQPVVYIEVTWPAPGSEDTELGVLMELEVGHGETEVYARVQA